MPATAFPCGGRITPFCSRRVGCLQIIASKKGTLAFKSRIFATKPMLVRTCRLLSHQARSAVCHRHDRLAYITFPRQHWAKLHSTNPIKRFNGEIKHRTKSPGASPAREQAPASSTTTTRQSDWLALLLDGYFRLLDDSFQLHDDGYHRRNDGIQHKE